MEWGKKKEEKKKRKRKEKGCTLRGLFFFQIFRSRFTEPLRCAAYHTRVGSLDRLLSPTRLQAKERDRKRKRAIPFQRVHRPRIFSRPHEEFSTLGRTKRGQAGSGQISATHPSFTFTSIDTHSRNERLDPISAPDCAREAVFRVCLPPRAAAGPARRGGWRNRSWRVRHLPRCPAESSLDTMRTHLLSPLRHLLDSAQSLVCSRCWGGGVGGNVCMGKRKRQKAKAECKERA